MVEDHVLINMIIEITRARIARTMEKEQIIKTVKYYGGSGHVYMPKKWVGKKVKIILID